jgi:hypothetical protein
MQSIKYVEIGYRKHLKGSVSYPHRTVAEVFLLYLLLTVVTSPGDFPRTHIFFTMKLQLSTLALWVFTIHAQSSAVCTNDLATSDDCTDVLNPIACYNQYRWNTRTLSCIEGKDDADRKRKVRTQAERCTSAHLTDSTTP